MLKTASSIANAIGALNYVGTWNANTNSPTITSSVGNKGDYYQVSTAGSTSISGISNWARRVPWHVLSRLGSFACCCTQ